MQVQSQIRELNEIPLSQVAENIRMCVATGFACIYVDTKLPFFGCCSKQSQPGSSLYSEDFIALLS